jgi:alkaline phosphatase
MRPLSALVLLFGLAAASGAAQPKNVIILIADGMGFAHVEIGSLYAHGASKAQPYCQWRHWPMRTTSANNQEGYNTAAAWGDFKYFLKLPTDSAAAATTIASGVKTRNYAVGVDADGQPVRTLIHDAEAMGKSTGVLSTVRITHATPASFVAQVQKRAEETEIARQMIHESAVDLILGPGHPHYDSDGKPRETPEYKFVESEATWEALRAGTAGADADGDGAANPWTLVDSTEGILALATGATPKRVFGLVPVIDTLQANRSGDQKADAFAVPFSPGIPAMADLMRAALNVLAQNPKGFFLMGEGGAVDWASHANCPGRLVEEQLDFDAAVAATAAWVEEHSSWEETLLIVTADHECGYVVGPGSDPEWKPIENRGKGVMPGFEFKSTGHTNQLVPLFARGAGADRFDQHLHGEDARLGKFTDNADIAKVVRAAWR